MYLLDVLTIVCTGLMIGNELAVSLFLNPAIWQLDEGAQTKALSLLARSLGEVMPFWYALCLVLLLVEAYIRRGGSTSLLLLAAVVIWAGVISCTILVLVPINKRIASLSPASLPAHWRDDHKSGIKTTAGEFFSNRGDVASHLWASACGRACAVASVR